MNPEESMQIMLEAVDRFGPTFNEFQRGMRQLQTGMRAMSGGAQQSGAAVSSSMARSAAATDRARDALGKFVSGGAKAQSTWTAFAAGAKKGEQAADAFRAKMSGVQELATGLDQVANKMLMVGAAGVAGAGLAVKSFQSFDTPMRNVNSLAQLSESAFADLEEQVLKIAQDPRIKDGPASLAEGLYQIQSSGLSGQVALDTLRISSMGASAGLSDTFTSASALVGIMNAYNTKTGPDAQHIMDVLFKTVDQGVITFEQLASSIGPLTSMSAQLEMPLEQVAAAIVTLTRVGIPVEQVMISLQALLRAFMSATPDSGLGKAIENLTGQSASALIKTQGLAGAIKALATIADQQGEEALAQMGLDVRTLRAVFPLAGKSLADFNAQLEGMGVTAGWTERALSQQMQASSWQTAQFKKQMEILGVQFGKFIYEGLMPLIKGVNNLLSVFIGLPDWAKKLIARLAGTGGLIFLFAALAVKLVATAINTGLAIVAGWKYIATLKTEAMAALKTAAANKALAAARAQAAQAAAAHAGSSAAATTSKTGGAGLGAGMGFGGVATIGLTAFAVSMAGMWEATVGKDIEQLDKSIQNLDSAISEASARGLQTSGIEAGENASPNFWNTLFGPWTDVWRRGPFRESETSSTGPITRGAAPETAKDMRERVKAASEKATQQEMALLQAQVRAGAVDALKIDEKRAQMLESMRTQWVAMTDEQRKSEDGMKLQIDAWGLYGDNLEATKKRTEALAAAEQKRHEEAVKALNDELALMSGRINVMSAYTDMLEAAGASKTTIGQAKAGIERGYWQQAQQLQAAARSPLLSPVERLEKQSGAWQAVTNAINVFKQEREALQDAEEKLMEQVSDPTFYLGEQLEASRRSIDALTQADQDQTAAMNESIDAYQQAMDVWFGKQPIMGNVMQMAQAQQARNIAGGMDVSQLRAYGANPQMQSTEQMIQTASEHPGIRARAQGSMYGMSVTDIDRLARQRMQEGIVAPNVQAAQERQKTFESWAQAREAEAAQSANLIQAKIDEANASKALAAYLMQLQDYMTARTGLAAAGKPAGPQPPGMTEGAQAMAWALMQGVYAAQQARAYEESRTGALAGVGQPSSMGRQ